MYFIYLYLQIIKTMQFVNQIKSILSKYTYDWFLEMKVDFKQDTWYDKKQDKIVIEYSDIYSDYDPETLEMSGTEETIIFSSYTLEEFCWSYTNRHHSHEESESRFGDNSIFFVYACSEIISIIKKLLNEVVSINEKEKLISSTINLIIEELEKLSSKQDIEYKNLVAFFIQKIRLEFGKHFISIKDINTFIGEYQDKLEFNLNQEELAVFLSIIIKADILKVDLVDDSNINKFAARYFYFTHAKNGKLQPAKNIRKKMSDYKNDEILPTTIEKVIKQLHKALK